MRSVSAILASVSLTVAACGGSGSSTTPPSSLTVTLAASTIVSGTSVQATATLNGSPASNVSWSSSNTGVADVSSTGLIRGGHKGSSVIRATSGGFTGSATVTVTPGAPVSLLIYSGNNQSGAKGSTLADPLCTNVVDAAGNLLVGAVVTYTVATGGGQLGQPTAPATNANGIAISGLWSLGSTAGAQTVVASYSGLPSVTFTATAQ
jgi:Big-like domain-containing protein